LANSALTGRRNGFAALRGALNALRDRIGVDNSAHLGGHAHLASPETLYPLDGVRLAPGSTNGICHGADANLYMMRGSVGWELHPPTCTDLSVNHYVDVACS